jgi:hypothetical protein
MIKAIETVYNGYRMRSRLEARWAVFFDAFGIGIKWEYEPEGLILPDGTRYLPDFFLPSLNGGMYAEVKPEGADFEKAHLLAVLCTVPVLLCEGIPDARLYHYWMKEDVIMVPDNAADELCQRCDLDTPNPMVCWPCKHATGTIRQADGVPVYVGNGRAIMIEIKDNKPRESLFTGPFARAVSAARQARFEHGEQGGR